MARPAQAHDPVHGHTPEAAPESRAKLEAELDWLDETLSDDHRFLAGERFSRVDLTVAALLAHFARPEQAGVYNAMTLPPALEEDVARWRHLPTMACENDLRTVPPSGLTSRCCRS